MASQIHITANFDKRERIVPKDHVEAYDALKKEIDAMKDSANLLKRQVMSGSQSQASSVIRISASSAASAASVASAKTSQVSLVLALSAAIATPITFTAPAQIRSYPTCWTMRDGSYGPVSFTPDYTNLPHGFTITADVDCTMYMTYEPL
jgi:hypothetical protein